MATKLTAAQARRVAVAAQGFHEAKPAGPVTRGHLKRLVARLQVLQLDSVSVAVRAHYAPVFSRLGPYDRDILDRAAWSHSARSPRLLVEYWAHEAALMAVDDWPLLRWRMGEYQHGRWGTEIVKKNAKLADDVIDAVAALGPSTAGQIEAHLESEPRRARGPGKKEMWDRSDTKWVAEALWAAGALTTATRIGFARHYDLTERVLPAEVVERRIDEGDAIRELALRAATALGIGTEADIRDYFRLGARQVKPAIADLLAAGELELVDVDGLDRTGIPAGGPDRAAPGPGDRAVVPVRPADLLPAQGRATVRIPLPHRDLHSRPRNASSATTYGRSCSTGIWWAASTSRPTARQARCRWSARSPRTGGTARGWRRRWRGSCGRWRAGWGLTMSASVSAGI